MAVPVAELNELFSEGDHDCEGMIREWISGLHFFLLLSFHPGAAAKGNFLSLFPPCVRQRLVDSLGLLSLPLCAFFPLRPILPLIAADLDTCTATHRLPPE